MGLCISIFQSDTCKACNVPASYYMNEDHKNRPSCRVSTDKYHIFQDDVFYSKIT